MNPDFLAWSGNLQVRIETALEHLLPDPRHAPQTLHAAMRHAALGGGKRVRPLLAFAAGEVAGADPARVEIAACAVELIHAYSLVHDDMPCMDNDMLRRGKPTCHVEYGEATALLAGDGLHSLAFELLSGHTLSDTPERQLDMVKLLASAAGSRGMAGGQAIDLASVGQTLTLPELEFMHIHKTGALIRAAVLLGAYCGAALDNTTLARLDRYAKCVGLAFQVVDDILDAEAPTATLGKTAGKDAQHNKPTYVTLMGSTRAKAFAAELHRDALDALAGFDSAQRLRELADFIVQRQF
ncbi:(2E,6E)-farnesyl diphosphate synthase [Sulfuriferula plumbiphila]|uniref:(2E,6E)-farnesyl diphosphate synthase n=1 Tax=Sulfuriferula plumbiphila TaxID=171865 RepID=A0A512L7F3_9PROT|nr:farnesyl diphosphate synthase [Sulfuriferula plumbiphila]BBP05367.1 (2E,6E)-farnesyl diphosphate synthase [Sulfuriferula plumbiphila]GEP30404.1 (2E,6E)-farnesyl diphosphate synthase [Sulfuriferula plumbiphila]